jgi:TM2 domain-containing membrane protein YozV
MSTTIHQQGVYQRGPDSTMSGPGSAGNVISALASFIYPGLGQLVQGRLLAALAFFLLATVLWLVLLGWIIHLWATIDAALYRP